MSMTGHPACGARNVLIIYNPTSGWRRASRFRSVIERLNELGCSVVVRVSEYAGHAILLAKLGAAENFDVIVAAGGDGTINELANALPPEGPPLGVIPLGTANILAWEIGLGLDAGRVARTIAFGGPRPITVGRVNGRRFLLMVGVGYDGAVVADVSPTAKRWLGKSAYVFAGLAQMALYGWPRLVVTIDGVARPCAMAIVSKVHYYAGRFVLARDANPEEPLFRVCLFSGKGAWNLLRYGMALVLGRLAYLPDVAIFPATDVRIESPPGVPVQADGDAIGATAIAISIAPERIAILWPEAQ
jgi:YegS/Rv2252/BmrU family lipid kinase